MLFTTALSCFLISWSSVFLLDYVLRLKNFASYVNFANRYGLEVAPFQLRLYTTRFHESPGLPSPKSSPTLRRTIASLWFSLGAIISLICLIGITIYLSQLLYKDAVYLMSLRPKVVPYRSIPDTNAPNPVAVPPIDDLPPPPQEEYDILDGGQNSDAGLVPIIPGVNLPWSHIPIFMVVLIVAAIIHELGHSAAATTHNVRVNGFGIFLLALYPGAFTDIDPESLKRSDPRHKLKIFGGGIWHNLVLAGVAYLMFLGTPVFLSPLFVEGPGVTVTAVDVRSGLHGVAGLSSGFIVESIEGCPIRRLNDWRECVRMLEHQRNGRCVATSRIEATRAVNAIIGVDELHCCDDFTNITHAHMCFERSVLVMNIQHVTKAHSLKKVLRVGAVEPPVDFIRKSSEWSRQYSCMSARFVTDQPICNTSVECDQDDYDDRRVCIFPALYNGTQLARITVRSLHRPVLYVGNLDELISFVSIDPLVARFNWVPYWWASAVELVPKYLFTLSLALALLNSVPCYALDGQYLVITLVNWIFKNLPKRRRQQIISLILMLGSFLLAANIFIGFVKMAMS